jgi:hypothetical protein
LLPAYCAKADSIYIKTDEAKATPLLKEITVYLIDEN